MMMHAAAMVLGGYAVIPPRLGLTVYGSSRSLMIFRTVFRMSPGRYC